MATARPFVKESAVNLMRAFLIGRDPTKPSEFRPIIEAAVRVLGLRVWFIEAAILDIAAKAAGLPLYRYLGGARERIPAYASFGEMRPAKQRVEDALAAADKGFKAIKLRPRHDDMLDDIDEVRIVRDGVGDRLQIACDANQGWRVDTFKPDAPRWDFKRALATAKAYEEFDVMWLEEPLDQFDFEGYRALRAQTTTKIAAGELAGDIWPVRELIERRAVDIIQPDAMFTGGITGAVQIARMAQVAGLEFAPHTWSGNGIGLVANLHVIGATHGAWLEYPYDPPSFVVDVRDQMLTEPIEVDKDGYVTLPQKPGLGIDLNIAEIEKHGTAI
ncbi:MAG: mandelate racemase/muconate lactonizing enzyme family protein [Actinobacteria bacterium]|nr:mandelate racemase/muconate lactonizing enzyme family protein [Actinomycetota bacterium]